MQYLNPSLCVMWVYETVYCGSYLILAPTPHSWKECTGKGFIGFCAMGCTCSIFHYSICDNYTCSGIVIPTTRLVMYRYAPSLNYLHAIKKYQFTCLFLCYVFSTQDLQTIPLSLLQFCFTNSFVNSCCLVLVFWAARFSCVIYFSHLIVSSSNLQVCTAKMNLSDEVDLEDYVSRPDKISAADVSLFFHCNVLN